MMTGMMMTMMMTIMTTIRMTMMTIMMTTSTTTTTTTMMMMMMMMIMDYGNSVGYDVDQPGNDDNTECFEILFIPLDREISTKTKEVLIHLYSVPNYKRK